MTEMELSVSLARKILDMPNLDPDSDICVLARQLLRREERILSIIGLCGNAGHIAVLDRIKRIASGEEAPFRYVGELHPDGRPEWVGKQAQGPHSGSER